MTLHIIKLFVGLDTLSELAEWQTQRLEDLLQSKQEPELIHVTRNTPKRASEILDGGSLYWVMRGWIVARQRLLEMRPLIKDGVPHCGLVYDRELVRVQPRPRRPFQGWRYLDPKDAPPDMSASDISGEFTEEMWRELKAIGFL